MVYELVSTDLLYWWFIVLMFVGLLASVASARR